MKCGTLLIFLVAVAVTSHLANAFELKEHKKTEIKAEDECRKAGGVWWSPGMPGNPRPKICDLPTKDKGKTCSDSSECEGYCLSSTKFFVPLLTKGKCSASIYLVGCNSVLESSSVKEICVD